MNKNNGNSSGTVAINRNLPVHGRYDVVVCGGGPAGFSAALAARRSGLSVLLVERQGVVGGMGTAGLVSHWLGVRMNNGTQYVVGGICREFIQEAAALGIAVIPRAEDFADVPYIPYGQYKGLIDGIPFDPFAMASFIEQKLIAAGVEILLQTHVADVITDCGRVTHVVLAGKEGLFAVEGTAFVDATGDADVAAQAGCEFVKGDEKSGEMCVVSLIFHLDNVDEAALMDYVVREDDPRFKKLLTKLRNQGEDCFNYSITIFVKMPRYGSFMVNGLPFPGVDGTDSASRTGALVAVRDRNEKTLRLFQRHYPGCANARIRAVAMDLGVRETRRITGEYRLTVADVRDGREFPDTIGFTPYGWDLAKSDGTQPMHGVSKPPVVPIPYRIMVPRGLRNVICPGRAVSVERDVLGPMRVMGPVMAMGEAAGLAAAQVVTLDRSFAAVDIATLRTALRSQGAIVDAEALRG
ncbi:MAG: FAD-dependent oxidoreductase [bacterium]